MDALKVAFETVIIGALALPWVLLALDLFLQSKEGVLASALQIVKDQQLYTVAAILLFAVTYFMGAAISRLAGDFFNDDDLGIPMTEDNIRCQVYTNTSEQWLTAPGVWLRSDPAHPGADPVWFGVSSDKSRDDEKLRARRVFELQESSLLLLGVDKTGRLQHMHQQMLILRGAALNGVIVSLLFLFGFCAKHEIWGKWVLAGLCAALLAWAGYAGFRHFTSLGSIQQLLMDPPLMEVTLLLILSAGVALLWTKVEANRAYGVACVVAFVLTFVAYAGWWWTEVIYDEFVINLFNAHVRGY